MSRLYSLKAAEDYVSKCAAAGKQIESIAGSLLDDYIIIHEAAIEILEAQYLNVWSSAYVRHIYRKRSPKGYLDSIARECAEARKCGETEYADELLRVHDEILRAWDYIAGSLREGREK